HAIGQVERGCGGPDARGLQLRARTVAPWTAQDQLREIEPGAHVPDARMIGALRETHREVELDRGEQAGLHELAARDAETEQLRSQLRIVDQRDADCVV